MMKNKKKILFVCSANTCRSPAAEWILREYGSDRYEAASAGLFARNGEPMMPEVAQALAGLFGREVDYRLHASARLTSEKMHESDAVVAVSEGYASLIRTFFPKDADKVSAFPEGIADLSRLYGSEMDEGIRRIRNQVALMFLSDEKS